ncbi:hypothetical protein B005_3565 [Nocardiopsis alba ATCC BAA-2165]|uniref:Uncharacterized protein n=1 Tax=Nocardiopsis alba (strain ATCC BAA-2165 / BE74) TaxID=1205910 RepID=J7LFT5_NOCAA|nr:hypothetical protein B005_3565 [Nocardiopsis alba ATCC BAA-2165]
MGARQFRHVPLRKGRVLSDDISTLMPGRPPCAVRITGLRGRIGPRAR